MHQDYARIFDLKRNECALFGVYKHHLSALFWHPPLQWI